MSRNRQKVSATASVLSFLVFVVGGAGHATIASAQSPATFTPTGNMNTPRFGHTATLLADGRVLIAGGLTGTYDALPAGNATATAELYDPATGMFTPTGSMTAARAYHTATLLADGKVLIAAGHAGARSDANMTTAELYDPSTGTFTATGSMSTPSVYDTNTATLLSDGRVLVAGCASRAEIYDPATGTFMAMGNTTVELCFTTATLLPDDRVLLATNTTSKLYDPRTGTFSLTDNDKLLTYAATLLPNGKVLKAGGNNDPGPTAVAELYDPSIGTFTLTGSMIQARGSHTATLLPDGKALFTGGSSWSGTQVMLHFCCVNSAELYDASSGLFAETASMAAPRADHTATVLSDGRVLIAGGGSGYGFPALATAELYTPVRPVPPPRLYSLTPDGKGQGAIQRAGTTRLASSSDPAGAGEYLEIYLTGLSDGNVIPPQVSIGGRLAEVLWFGNTPGFAGLNQIDVRVPNGLPPGTVPVRVTYLSRPSNEVTIGVR